MDDNLKIITAEFEKLKGQFVITDNWDVKRLIAIGSDDMDYYYVCYDGRKIHWFTCVGRIIPLKGKIDDEHYNEFIRMAKLNHFDQPTFHNNNPDEFIKQKEGDNSPPITYKVWCQQHKREMENVHEDSKFLTEVCWDLN